MTSVEVHRRAETVPHQVAWQHWLWLAPALLIAVLFALPVLYLWANGVPLLMVAHESISYRYFDSLRVLGGDPVFLPQGASMGVLQHLLNLGLTYIARLPLADLRPRMNIFGYATLFINAAMMGAVVAVAFLNRKLDWLHKLLIATAVLVPIYGSRGQGIDFAIKPDYYVFEMTITVAVVVLAFVRSRSSPESGNVRLAGVGAFAGLLGATKITFVLTSVLMLCQPFFEKLTSLKDFIRRLLVAGLAGALTCIAITWGWYLFSPEGMRKYLAFWGEYLSMLGGESNFWASFSANLAKNPYVWLAATWLIVVFLSCGVELAGGAPRLWVVLLGVSTFLAGCAQVWILVRRPANTTLFEVGLFLLASTCTVLGTMRTGRIRLVASVAVSVLALGYAGQWARVNFTSQFHVQEDVANGTTVWSIHQWLLDQHRPVLFFIPDNDHSAGLVEEALLKGLSDTPTWNITAGQAWIDRLEPGLNIQQSLSQAPPQPGSIVLWNDPDGAPKLQTKEPLLQKAVSSAESCRQWRVGHVSVNACTLPGLDTGASISQALNENATFAEGTVSQPIPGYWISPAGAKYTVERLRDDSGPFVRVRALAASSYLVVNGDSGLARLRNEPVVLRAQVRGHSQGQERLALQDDPGGGRSPTLTKADRQAEAGWATLTVQDAAFVHAGSSVNFSVGLVNVSAGDWFDVREVGVFSG